jgi:hypothetical protein
MTIEHDGEAYRIVDGDDAGDLVDFGEAAVLESGGALYAAFLDSPLKAWDGCEVMIYRLSPVATETEEVEFDDEDDAGDDDEEDGDAS